MSNIEALLTTAIERANKQSPGLLGWSDIRFELDKLRSEKVRDIVVSLFAGASLEQINEAYQIVLEKEQEARRPPPQSQSSTLPKTLAARVESVQQLVNGVPYYDENGTEVGRSPPLITQDQALNMLTNGKLIEVARAVRKGSGKKKKP